MARYEIIDGERVLVNRTKIAGRDNIQDLPKTKPAKKVKAKKAKSDEVKT